MKVLDIITRTGYCQASLEINLSRCENLKNSKLIKSDMHSHQLELEKILTSFETIGRSELSIFKFQTKSSN